jgi:hypothetical protein
MGAGAGGAELQQILATRFREQLARQLEGRRAMEADRAFEADQQQKAIENAYRLAGALPSGSELDPNAANMLRAGNLHALIRQESPTLASTALSGVADATNGVPRLLRIAGVVNPGHGARDVYTGTAGQRLAEDSSRALAEQREAVAAARRSEAEARAGRERLVEQLSADPSIPQSTRHWLTGAAAGFNQLTPHDYESPDQHGAHVALDRRAKINDAVEQHQAIRNYDITHPLPIRGVRLAGGDNPQLPNGAQRYALDIARKHGTNYAAALAEANDYLSSQDDHPNLSAQKFIGAVQQAMRRPAGASRIVTLGGQPLAGAASIFGGSSNAAPAAVASGSGRGSAAGPSSRTPSSSGTVKMRAPNGQERDVPAAMVGHYKQLGAAIVR